MLGDPAPGQDIAAGEVAEVAPVNGAIGEVAEGDQGAIGEVVEGDQVVADVAPVTGEIGEVVAGAAGDTVIDGEATIAGELAAVDVD